jgi:epoxyqueuosine reductase
LTISTLEENPKKVIRKRALELGFDAVGFASADQGLQSGERLEKFLRDGWHGDMGWLQARKDQRKSPHSLWPEARSAIVLGLNYGPERDPMEILSKPDYGAISVYASGKDYHDVVKKKLRILAREIHQGFECEVKIFVDTAPIMEKPLAENAGVGWQGKHTNLVSRENGSWLFLGEIFTTLELIPDNPEPDHCGNCERCIDVCPTQAIREPYRLDARRCISYLTIEHKGPIPLEFRTAIGNRIFGCDDCLAICPWNKFASQTKTQELLAHSKRVWPRLEDLIKLDDPSFRKYFSGSPVKRLGRDRFIRNVAIAIGNTRDRKYESQLVNLLKDQSASVRGAAIWALRNILEREEFQNLRDHYSKLEVDPYVLEEWRPNCDNDRQ